MKIFNPVYESGDKMNPYINPKWDQMHKPFPDNSKKIWHSHGIGNNIFNPIYKGGDKITPDINPKCIGLTILN